MTSEMWAIVIVLGVILGLFVLIYNRIIALVQTRKNAFSDIDVQLKLRQNLIPNLVETVKGYATHERGVFDSVTAARASALRGGSIADRAQAESVLGSAMMNLMAVSENYPQLKADVSFQKLQAELSDVENKIAASRRYFNNATSEYNAAIQQFPAVMVARIFGFHEEVFFELGSAEQEAVRKDMKVSF